jgi:hypothetical protein
MFHDKRRQEGHRAWLVVMLAAALAIPSCRRNDTEPSEAGFAVQAASVREGHSEQIRLDHTVVGDEQLGALDGLEDKLRRINLSHSHITDAGLARIAGMRRLEQLRLASDRVTDEGLACLAQLKELRHLHLIGMPITDEGLVHLEALAGLSSLYLDGTKLTEEGAGRLVEALGDVHLHFDGGHYPGDTHAEHKH